MGDAPAAPVAEGTAPPMAGPVVNRMSHFTLYQYDRSPTTSRANFRYLPATTLDSLIGGGAAGAGGPGAMMMGSPGGDGGPLTGGAPGGDGPAAPGAAAGGSPRAGWKPVGVAGTGGTGGVPGLSGSSGEMGSGGPPGMAPAMPGGSGMPGAPVAGRPGSAHRTEFLIYFIWKEPKPSDELRDFAAAPAETGAASKFYAEKTTPASIRPARQLPYTLRSGGLPKEAIPPLPPFEAPPAAPGESAPAPEGAVVPGGAPAKPAQPTAAGSTSSPPAAPPAPGR